MKPLHRVNASLWTLDVHTLNFIVRPMHQFEFVLIYVAEYFFENRAFSFEKIALE